MQKLRVAFFDVTTEEKKYFEEKLRESQEFAVTYSRAKLNRTTATKFQDAEAISAFVYSKLDSSVLELLPRLKLISTMSTGFDHIDLAYCKEKGITVCNVPVYGEKTVAEHTFALMLSLSRKIPQSLENVRKLDFRLDELQGFDLDGKTLGLVGLGHIGANVARIAKSFGMKLLVSDPHPDQRIVKSIGARLVSLPVLLKHSDIISLHAPYNVHTHHLINRDNILQVKPGAYLINTARGGLIETEALLLGLHKGLLAGAGIDVLEEESFIKEEQELLKRPQGNNQMLKTVLEDHLLLNDPRVIITPHNAFNSREALQRILDTSLLNIRRFASGRPINVVK
jgi:D-lactate dehydrogenase